jgi:hypothetical protein
MATPSLSPISLILWMLNQYDTSGTYQGINSGSNPASPGWYLVMYVTGEGSIPTTFNFEPGDKLVAFAQANQMQVRGHNLCWHTQFPPWLGPYAQTATPAMMSALLENHINAVTRAASISGLLQSSRLFTNDTPVSMSGHAPRALLRLAMRFAF